MIDINLLPTKNEMSLVDRGRKRILFLVVALTSGVFLLLASSTLIFWFSLRGQEAAWQTQESRVLVTLANYDSQARQLSTIKEKLGKISEIRRSQFPFTTEINDLQGVVGPYGTIRSFTLDRAGNVTVVLETTNYRDLSTLLSKLASSPDTDFLKETKIDSVSVNTSAAYPLSFSAKYSKQKGQ